MIVKYLMYRLSKVSFITGILVLLMTVTPVVRGVYAQIPSSSQDSVSSRSLSLDSLPIEGLLNLFQDGVDQESVVSLAKQELPTIISLLLGGSSLIDGNKDASAPSENAQVPTDDAENTSRIKTMVRRTVEVFLLNQAISMLRDRRDAPAATPTPSPTPTATVLAPADEVTPTPTQVAIAGTDVSPTPTSEVGVVMVPAAVYQMTWDHIVKGFLPLLIVALGLIFLTPTRLKRSLVAMRSHKGSSIVHGLLLIFAAIFISFLMIFVIIGIPFGLKGLMLILTLFGWIFFAVMLYLARVLFALMIGSVLEDKFWKHSKYAPYISACVGIAVVLFAFELPAVGWVLSIIGLLWGLGGAIAYVENRVTPSSSSAEPLEK